MLKGVTINKKAKKHLRNKKAKKHLRNKPTSFVYIIKVTLLRFVMINKVSSYKIWNMKCEVVKPTHDISGKYCESRPIN